MNYKGYIHHASEDDPQYEIKSDKTDHVGRSQLYGRTSVGIYYAPQEGESDERMDRDVLLSALASADERALFTALIRLALVTHLREPYPGQPDYLKRAISAFGLEPPKKKAAKKTLVAKAKTARSGKKPKTRKGAR